MASVEEYYRVAGEASDVRIVRGGEDKPPRGGKLVKFKVRWLDVDGAARGKSITVIEGRKAEAERTLTDLLAQIEAARGKGIRWQARDAERVPLLADAIKAYSVHFNRAVASGNRSDSTFEKRAAVLKWFLAFVGENAAVSALSSDTLTRFYDGRDAAASSRFQYASHVRALWAWVSVQDAYRAHVAPPPTLADLAIFMPVSAAPVAPTWAECDAAIGALPPGSSVQRAAMILRYTGIRIEQAIKLRAEDFDLTAATLTIRPGNGKSRAEKRGRVMPIAPAFVEELKTWDLPSVGPFLTPDTGTRGAITADAYRKRIADAWARAGVRPEAWAAGYGRDHGKPCHAFRTAFETELRTRGADHASVEFLVGHTDQSVARFYLDPSYALNGPPRDVVDAVARIGGPYPMPKRRKLLRIA